MASHKFTSQSNGQADNVNTQGYGNRVLRKTWGLIDHPPYSPDWAPSDFHLFRYLKEFLGGKRYDTAGEVKEEVQDWLSSLAADVYDLGIQKLVERYDKCLNKYGKVQAERHEKEENEYKQKQGGLILELERMKLSMTATSSTNTSAVAAEKINIQLLIPRFVETSDISPYLKIFERQREQVNIGEVDYVTHLLPKSNIEISHISLREPKEKLENYQHIKQVLLQRFKLSAESFRLKFSAHQKQPETLWKGFAYSVQKLDDYEVARGKTSNYKVLPDVKRTSSPSKLNKQISTRTVDKAKEAPRISFGEPSQLERRTPLSCYGCGKPGYIKSKCPDCNPSKGDPDHFGILLANSLSPSTRNAVLRISINRVPGTAFADSGASHSIAGETLYGILFQQGSAFEKTAIFLSFDDGIVTQKEVLRTLQTILLECRRF
ncbi:uncharacterized protein TNCV_3765861 [Trichonephila clavipes]|nr:uncharacterized protein TNCV_3765861 [Trichonephila clavipes]